MEFDSLRTLSNKLECSIQNLERKLRDSSSILYEEGSADSEGMRILKDLHVNWKKICEDLEEANKKDEAEIKELLEDFESYKSIVDDLKLRKEKCKSVLVQKKLLNLSCEENVNLSDIDPIPEVSGALSVSPSVNSTFFAVPTVPANSTFLAEPPPIIGTTGLKPDVSSISDKENISDYDNTMSEFQMKANRKTFVLRKNY